MPFAPTSYKNRRASRCPCLLCQTLTKGRTVEVYLGYGVWIRLCERHASREFIRADTGRHFLLTVGQALASAGRTDRRTHKALLSFSRRFGRGRTQKQGKRQRPGSYAWPAARAALEKALKRKALTIRQMVEFIEAFLKAELRRGRVRMPSIRTLRRWRFERRWDELALDAPG